MPDFVVRTEVKANTLHVYARRADGEVKEFDIPHAALMNWRKLPAVIGEVVDFLVGRERDATI